MNTEKIAAKRSKVHTRYKTKDGTLVPGVTTVLGVLAKPALVPWANNLGLQGIKVGAYVDVLAQAGTIAHDMICCHLNKREFDATDLSADIIDSAETCFLKYLEWEKHHDVETIISEGTLVSEELRYGGTVDHYAKIDGVLTLQDFKTAKAIWPEHLYQVAAYRALLVENGYKVDAVGILQIGRNADEGFSERTITDSTREFEIFKCCLRLYELKVGK
jgi:hypothetical protein